MRATSTQLRLGFALAAFAFNSSCGAIRSEDEHRNEGVLCLAQTQSGALQAQVFTDDCYSGSCSEATDQRCEVFHEGETLRITSVVKVESWGGTCTFDCHTYSAACQLEGVPSGEYRLVHGEFETTVTLPLIEGKWREEGSDNGFVCP